MRILFLTQVLPYPLDAGPKARAYYVLRYLAQHHEVTLVSFVRETDTDEAVTHLRTFCRAVHTTTMPRSALLNATHLLRSLATGQPFIIARDRVDSMFELLREVAGAGAFDAVHADQLWMAPYALWVKEELNAVQKSVLDQHNAVYLIPERMSDGEKNPAKRLLLAHESRKLIRYEIETCGRFDDVVWVTQEDYDAVAAHLRVGESLPQSAVIPICGAPDEVPPISRTPCAKRVTFVGGLHYPPNAQGICWYAEHAFPQVLADAPDAVLTVIGKQPPDALHSYNIPPSNLDVAGFVSDEEMQRYLAETAVFVVPLLAGGGMRVKILDGWTWRMPILSTTVGAEGIDYRCDKQIKIADSPEELAEDTLQLLHDFAAAQSLADAGRAWVTERYGWQNVYRDWDKIYQS